MRGNPVPYAGQAELLGREPPADGPVLPPVSWRNRALAAARGLQGLIVILEASGLIASAHVFELFNSRACRLMKLQSHALSSLPRS